MAFKAVRRWFGQLFLGPLSIRAVESTYFMVFSEE
jgi:hypothetical protein